MPLTPGTATLVSATSSAVSLSSGAASGGTGPYTYQWLKSSTGGSSFAPIGGATALTYTDSAVTRSQQYIYLLQVTDTGAGNATAVSNVVYAETIATVTSNRTVSPDPEGTVDDTIVTTSSGPALAVTNADGTPIGSSASSDEQVLNIAGVTTTPVAVTFGQTVKAVSIQARTATTVLQFRRLSGDSTYFTVPAGKNLSFTIASPSTTIGYVNTLTGTDVVEVMATY